MHTPQIQFVGTTPEELNKLISCNIKQQLDELKNYFQHKEPEQLMTRKEVAEFLKISLSTLHEWTKSGKLKAYGKGNRVYYKRSEIEDSLIEINP